MDDLIAGVGLGLAAGAGFGPINVAYTQVSLTSARRDVVAFAAVAVSVDMALLLLGVAGGSRVLDRDTAVGDSLCVLAAAVVFVIGGQGLVSAGRGDGPGSPGRFPDRRPAATALILGVTNPLGIALWVSIGSAIGSAGSTVVQFAGAWLGDMVWFVGWGAAASAAGSRLSMRVIRRVDVLSSVALAVAGALLLVGCFW